MSYVFDLNQSPGALLWSMGQDSRRRDVKHLVDLATYDLRFILYVDDCPFHVFSILFQSFSFANVAIFPRFQHVGFILRCQFSTCLRRPRHPGMSLMSGAVSSRASSKTILTSRLQPRLLFVKEWSDIPS